MLKFFGVNLPKILNDAQDRFSANKDLLWPFATDEMNYAEFAARVRRREEGTNEDNDWPEGEPEPEPDPDDFY